ncbi:hypothetical protein ACFOHK_01040 [Falsigemmobacter intermedius]|nr:hypothetical protein [Falsigemmobacter intermedius]
MAAHDDDEIDFDAFARIAGFESIEDLKRKLIEASEEHELTEKKPAATRH